MSEVQQLQNDLRQEMDWARSQGYTDLTEIVDGYKDEYPQYSNWFDEVALEY